jgi:oligogalacturonide lyase
VRRLTVAAAALLLSHAASAQRAPVLETGVQRPMPDEWIDRATGHRVVRLTRREGSNESFYFHNDPFVPRRAASGGLMVFTGATPTGRQLFTVALASRVATQLTDRDGGVSGEIVAPRHREALWQRGDSVFATHLDTKRTRLLAALPAGLHASVTTLNADETLLGGVIAGPEVRAILAQYPAKRDFFDRIFAAHPRHTLFVVDLKTGALRTIREEQTWIGHVQFSPTDPDLLMFCHEGPWQLVDRIWTIDVGRGTVRQIHHRTVDREIAGHEFFGADGRTIWYDLQIPRGETFYLAGADVATGKTVTYRMTRDEWSIHFNQSPDGALFAGDGGDSSQVARAANGRWLYLFRPQGDRLVSEKLVDMHAHDYKLEPNVHFTPDGAWVVFRANFEGQSEAYAVAVARDEIPLDPTASARAALVQPVPRDALPTLFYIGDSTVRNGNGTGANGEWGWGDLTPSYFDTTRLHVVNRALGGRSSRTFITQGHWDAVLAQLRKGDVVVMQFGHNDESPVNDTSRARGTLKGTGDETQEIDNLLTHEHEVVHTYGWYLREYVAAARAKGAAVVVASPVPRDSWQDGRVVRSRPDGYAAWAERVARDEGVPFIDLNDLIAREYEALGPDATHAFFPHDHTHTNRDGAALSARVAVQAMKALPSGPLAPYFR